MNILITLYSINNPGGIILNNEGLIAGLRALGHKATTRQLVWKDKVSDREAGDRQRRLTPETDVSGVPFDQELGWKWPAKARIAYRGKANLKAWKAYASTFDLIIWQIPVPTMQRDNEGNLDWLELYEVDVPQIVYIHDGNMMDSYPWIYAIERHLAGAIGVHPCAYNSLKYLPVPRALAFSPQQNIEERRKLADKFRDRNGWCSFQTFKAWKHVDDLVRAVPHMKNTEAKILGGGGINYYYMTSKDKLKPEFIAAPERDPDMPKQWEGKRIWELAIQAGMEYTDYLVTTKRDAVMHGARYVIDPSWSQKYAQIGDHFNRTIVEGIIAGCVPIARNLGVATNMAGNGQIFKANENYIMIPWNASPLQFASIVDEAINMKESGRRALLAEGHKLLPNFDYRRTAKAFTDLAAGKPAGFYGKRNDCGKFVEQFATAGQRVIDTFFSGKIEQDTEILPGF